MAVVVVGLNFKGAPLELLERFAFDQSELPKALMAARSSEHVREAVILSTCNRTEVYAAVDSFHAGSMALRLFLSEYHDVALEDFTGGCYGLYEDEAVRHLFNVAAGIDSMIVGEPQILSQVRRAFRVADEEGATSSTLSALFRQAISVGRRARAETDIASGASSMAAAASELAREAIGPLEDKTILVVGAGKMSDLAALALAREGARVLVANRTDERAHAVAARAGGEVVSMDALADAVALADVVLSSTGSAEPVITYDLVARAMKGRADRPLVLMDLAVPRDVEPLAGTIDGVVLRDMDDLREVIAPSAAQAAEIETVRAIIAEEVPRFTAWHRAHALAPLLAALQTRAEAVRAAELDRAHSILAGLSDKETEAVEALTRSILSKLLHAPVTNLKRHAGTAEGDALARALRMLFDLGEEG